MIIRLPKVYKWEKLVERNECPLIVDFLIRGVITENTKKVLGFKKGFERYLYLNRHVYWDQEEADGILDFITREMNKKGMAFLGKLVRQFIKNGVDLFALARKLGQEDNVKKNNIKLLFDFNKFCRLNWRLSPALLLPIAFGRKFSKDLENVLALRNLPEEKKKIYFIALTFPEKESTSTRELINFYLLSSLVKKEIGNKDWNEKNIKQALSSKKINKFLKKYLDNFSWIEARWYIGDGWQESDVIERMARLNPNQDFTEKTTEIQKLISKNRNLVKNIIQELKFSDKEIELINFTKQYVFVRTYRTDIFNQAGFIARPFLREIAKRLDVTFEQLIFLDSQEIINGLKNGKLENKLYFRIIERQKGFGALLNGKKLIFFDGKDIGEIGKRQNINGAVDGSSREIRGIIASSGRVIGPVKIVGMDKSGLSEVRIGDILVTSMTTPDFIPAMEKAAAFVTDEGGITCHAAIISREMKKPCIIGTKIATQVLKDGMMVEVDANKGIVKIL